MKKLRAVNIIPVSDRFFNSYEIYKLTANLSRAQAQVDCCSFNHKNIVFHVKFQFINFNSSHFTQLLC